MQTFAHWSLGEILAKAVILLQILIALGADYDLRAGERRSFLDSLWRYLVTLPFWL